MTRFVVREGEHAADAKPKWSVVDTRNDMVVASFATKEEAESHAARLAEGPFDLDEQENWKEEDEDWGEWKKWD